MNFVNVFVRRRVLAYMLSAAIILFGLIGLRDIGLDRMPNVSPPVVTVTTVNPGASPEIMDSSITSVIEASVNSISAIDYVRSRSVPSVSQVRVSFELSKDANVAFNEVQAKVNQVINDLPEEAETPIVAKIDPNAIPVMWLVLTGDRPLNELNRIARHEVKKLLENIDGVGEVLVGGGRERKIRVDLDLARMSALGLTAQDVIAAFAREHIQIPGGYLVSGNLEKLLHLDLEYHSVTELGNLVVIWRDQIPVKLGEISAISDGLSDKRSLAGFNGSEGVAIGIQKVQNANTVALVREVSARLDEIVRPSLADGVELIVATDESDIIEATVTALKNHVMEGTLLAALVVLFYLLNLPATLIIATAIPVSLAGAVVVMYFGDYTFNIMTLSGLLLLIGVVVDDAIVVLENIHRQHDLNNVSPEQAASVGTREVLFPVIAASLTLVCMFTAVIFMPGMVGIFMRSFAVVVVVGVIASLFVSLTLTPALCARFLVARSNDGNRLVSSLQRFHSWTDTVYGTALSWCLQYRWVVVMATALVVLSSGFFAQKLGAEFFPEDDESRFMITVKAPIGSSVEYMQSKIDQVEALVTRHEEVKHIFTTIGSANSDDVNEGTVNVMLQPKASRDTSQREVMNQIRKELLSIPGLQSYVANFPFISGMSDAPLQVYVSGPDFYELARLSRLVFEQLAEIPGMGDIRMDLQLDRPMLRFEIDRNRAKALGIDSSTLGDSLRVLAGGADIAKYSEVPGDGERYDIRVAAQRAEMRNADDLKNIYLRGPTGNLVRLDSVVGIFEDYGPAAVNRMNLNFAAEYLSTPDVSLAEAMVMLRRVTEKTLTPGYRLVLGGQADELEKSKGYLLFLFGTGLLLIYMVLASQFNSFLQPVLVMLAQPLAIVGGVFALWVTDYTLSIYSMIGLILLVGLVSKNSILLVDLINRYREEGMDTRTAIGTACPRRMRPVLMTSLTVVLAMSPAALGVGAGAGQYGPLAVAVIGGVISSTLLTLVVVPVAYSLLAPWLKIADVRETREKPL
ncbi:MAG: efflux RND transporter permease subunit [Halieaceae bacterium]|uniref:efflux RND transporter permease subunit n=1 Tax=Haliea alexandrii TaxID=2448162 RepID=UPI000F0BD926|nr:efflux RND transporter permease subunit [Haliea alexandrii]MCR9183906.1 efflux RND transporter permease subunit [Halieaceae bacterium]